MDLKLIPRKRTTRHDADRLAIMAIGIAVPVPVREGDLLLGPQSGAPVETIHHRFDVLAAYERYAAKYRAVVAAREVL